MALVKCRDCGRDARGRARREGRPSVKRDLKAILESEAFSKTYSFDEFVAGVKAGTIPALWGGDDEGTSTGIRYLQKGDELGYLVDAAQERGAMPEDEDRFAAAAGLAKALGVEPPSR
jgi:hypothetical protein